MRYSLLTPVLRTPSRAVGAALVAAGLSAAVGGCSFLTGIPDVNRVELIVTPNPVVVGQGATAVGTAFGSGGNIITNAKRTVVYSSSNTAVASVNPANGQIVAITPGTTDIKAEAGGKSMTVTLTVRIVPAKSVVITQRDPIFRVGATAVPGNGGLTAVAIDSVGTALRDRAVTWRSGNEAILSVNSGTVTPKAVGTAKIYATVDNGNGFGTVTDSVTATVTVPPISGGRGAIRVEPFVATLYPGDTQQYTATITDSLGNVVSGRPIIWTSSNPTVVSVDQNTGLATVLNTSGFSTQIIATVENIPGQSQRVASNSASGGSITTLPRPVATVVVDPTTLTLKAGQTSAPVQLYMRGANGQLLTGRPATCTPSTSGIVTVSALANSTQNASYQFTVTGQAAGSMAVVCKSTENASLPSPPSATLNVIVNP